MDRESCGREGGLISEWTGWRGDVWERPSKLGTTEFGIKMIRSSPLICTIDDDNYVAERWTMKLMQYNLQIPLSNERRNTGNQKHLFCLIHTMRISFDLCLCQTNFFDLHYTVCACYIMCTYCTCFSLSTLFVLCYITFAVAAMTQFPYRDH